MGTFHQIYMSKYHAFLAGVGGGGSMNFICIENNADLWWSQQSMMYANFLVKFV